MKTSHWKPKSVLLRNNAGQDNSWVGFSLQGTVSNRDAIGAKITVTSSGRTLTRWIVGGGSYLASQDKRVLVGLGSSARPVDADIRWAQRNRPAPFEFATAPLPSDR